jgi:GlpG protein
MRLIGEFESEKQAFGFQSFLQAQKISSVYELVKEEGRYRLWGVEEDDFDKALAFYQEWAKNPSDTRFTAKQEKSSPLPQSRIAPARSPFFTLNHLILFLCTLLFIMNLSQEEEIITKKGEAALVSEETPLEKALLFDESKIWKGVVDLFVSHDWKAYATMPAHTLFGNISQGEVWRLFTPVLLHGGLLHLLFNMAWVWMLGKLIEQRLGSFKYLLLTLVLAVFSNVFQYVMSGPLFFGYSGIVVGLVAFIAVRQKIAPWEGYPLHPSVVRFIAIYVFGLLGLGIVSMLLDFFHVTKIYANIANTAHLVGGITGILCAKTPFFSRSSR